MGLRTLKTNYKLVGRYSDMLDELETRRRELGNELDEMDELGYYLDVGLHGQIDEAEIELMSVELRIEWATAEVQKSHARLRRAFRALTPRQRPAHLRRVAASADGGTGA